MSGAFEAATGDGPPLPDLEAEQRSREVRAALDGLLQIRRVTAGGGGGDPAARPADWERRQPVRAVALLLEAAGRPPSALDASGTRVATGYRVAAGERPGTAVVAWLGPPGSGAAQEEEAALRACAAALERFGWDALLYKGPRRHRFLEVEPVGPDIP
ncbi:hypothetical protein RGF97_02575 [Streptomyces roseicoloratus]|uniref:Uncharacterized protein n=1 Tax=Streptomyces roseicoloratus TaxID=2508722 RepID=A0ABY9RR61_9ACTN|nr:hypothetical protein [Streptomyces roseicoloratus]WMX43966.1 hypothetical protein RGF97_02575 [Streptomyces roseicoloratus]